MVPCPEVWTWMPFGPFATLDEFLNWVESRIRSDPTVTLFTIFNKNLKDEENDGEKIQDDTLSIAGIIGLLNTSPTNLSTEIGFVITLPQFQRTHVTTHAIGVLLQWLFDDVRLRRIQWQADEVNKKSQNAAMRMGFRLEMVKRWDRALPPGKEGSKPREGDPKPDWVGRHSAVLAICWDDWEGGGKEVVQRLMDRR